MAAAWAISRDKASIPTILRSVFVFGENKIGNGFLSSAVGEIVVAV